MSIKYHDAIVGVTLGNSGGGGLLPDGYTQLEYIQSTGLEYIDSGIKDSSGLLLKGSVCYTGVRGSWDTICGAQDAAYTINANGLIMTYSNLGTYSSYVYDGGYDTSIPVVLGKMVDIVSDTRGAGHYFMVDGVRYFRAVSGSRGSTYNVFIFALNSAGSFSYSAIARVKHLALYNSSGVLVRDYYAAKRNADGVLGLYDLVSDLFYTNQGTGGFEAGPPIENHGGGKETSGAIEEWDFTSATPLIGLKRSSVLSSYNVAASQFTPDGIVFPDGNDCIVLGSLPRARYVIEVDVKSMTLPLSSSH